MAGSRRRSSKGRKSHRKRHNKNSDLDPNSIRVPGAEAQLENYYSFGGDISSFNWKTNAPIKRTGTDVMAANEDELRNLGYTNEEIGKLNLEKLPSVHLKLFYTDNCYSCTKLKNDTIPAMIEKYKGAASSSLTRSSPDTHPITVFGEIHVASDRKNDVINYYKSYCKGDLELPFIVLEVISPTTGEHSDNISVIPQADLEKAEKERRTKLFAIDTYGFLGLISPWALYADVLFDLQRDLLYSYNPALFVKDGPFYTFFGGERRMRF